MKTNLKKEEYCLFSNIALLNAKKVIEKNQDKNINEGNLENNLFINKKFIFENTNLYNFLYKNSYKKKLSAKKEKKNFNLDKPKKQAQVDKLKKQAQVDKLKKQAQENAQEIFRLIIIHLRLIRNLYSHKNPQHKDNQNIYNENQKKLCLELKEVTKNSSKTPIFNSFNERWWDIFIIQIFLFNDEWNEFNEKLEIDNIFKQFLRSYRIRLFKFKFKSSIYLEIINYLKNFNNTKNQKKAFIKISLKLLKYFKPKKHCNYNFKLNNNGRRGLIIDVEKYSKHKNLNETIKPKKTFNLNLQGVRQLLLHLQKNTKINDNIFQQKKLSEMSKLNEVHLLKLLNKSLILANFNDDKLILGKSLFSEILQFLQHENIEYINLKNDSTKKIIKLLSLSKEEQLDPNKWKQNIKKFILGKINNLEKYKKIFIKKASNSDTKGANIWKQNPKLFSVYNKNEKNTLYEPLFNFETKKDKKSNINKMLIAPILLFFYNNQNEFKEPVENEKFIEELFDNKEDNLPINLDVIKKTFKNRILNSKSKIFTKEESINKKIEIEILPKDYISNQEKINSKLFTEIYNLIQKNQIKNQLIEYKNILEKLIDYKKLEPFLLQWALNNEDNVKRDYILHRSISKFDSWKELKNLSNKGK